MTEPTSNMTRGHASRRARASRVKAARLKAVPTPVNVVKPDPLAWKYALKVVRGDTSRLQVVEGGAVVIHNNPIR